MNYLINKGINKNMSKKDKIQLAIIWGAAIVCWLAAFIWLQIYTAGPVSAASLDQQSNFYVNDKYDGDCSINATDGRCADKCPAGSYAIGFTDLGVAICKLEPTGCPFGDSVPLDKCAPPSDIICNVDWSVCEPRVTPPVTQPPSNGNNTAPTAKPPVSTSKPADNVKPDASYAAPNANDNQSVDDPAVMAPIANDDDNDKKPNAPLFAGIGSNEPDEASAKWFLITGAVYALISAAALAMPSSWFAAIGALIRNPFN